jgi:hypothetical protein
MRRLLRRSLCAAGAAVLTSGPGAAGAQGWSFLPDGSPAYTATYTSTGRFFCFGGGGIASRRTSRPRTCARRRRR